MISIQTQDTFLRTYLFKQNTVLDWFFELEKTWPSSKLRGNENMAKFPAGPFEIVEQEIGE